MVDSPHSVHSVPPMARRRRASTMEYSPHAAEQSGFSSRKPDAAEITPDKGAVASPGPCPCREHQGIDLGNKCAPMPKMLPLRSRRESTSGAVITRHSRPLHENYQAVLQSDLRMPFTVIDQAGASLKRTLSAPELTTAVQEPYIRIERIHPFFENTPSPRTLRIQEVRSWRKPWEAAMWKGAFDKRKAGESKNGQTQPSNKVMSPASASTISPTQSESPLTDRKISRPRLLLKLEDMPTTQEAEDLAQHAANKSMRRRRQSERKQLQLSISSGSPAIGAPGSRRTSTTSTISAGQTPQDREVLAIMSPDGSASISPTAVPKPLSPVPDESSPSKEHSVNVADLRLILSSGSSDISGSDSEPSPRCARKSMSGEWSPTAGQLKIKNFEVSEAGISSPDASVLHLQHDLARIREIGRGASGVVHKGVHVPTLKVVAIKDIPTYGKGNRRQMVRELHALYANLVPIDGKIRGTDERKRTDTAGGTPVGEGVTEPCPYIVSFYDAYVDKVKGCVSLVMEYMDMGSLQDLVLRGGCQSEPILARMADCILQALAHIHGQKMIHRDIKPHNILMNRQGDIKISDFGLARTLQDDVAKPKTFVGTLLYMAPERIGGGNYSYSADVWSFGLSLMSVALGKYPLSVQDGFFGLVDSVADDEMLRLPTDKFSPEFCSIIEKCLQRDPSKRPAAAELLKHPFLKRYPFQDHIGEWFHFTETAGLGENAEEELDAIADVVFNHHFNNALNFTFQTQSEYGGSLVSRFGSLGRRKVQIQPIQRSLQIGLAASLALPTEIVFEKFAEKRELYNERLLVEQSSSPKSWTSSPVISVHSGIHTPNGTADLAGSDMDRRGSIWRKIREGFRGLGLSRSGKSRKKIGD